jgi:cytochrome b involved in lipid metabolism
MMYNKFMKKYIPALIIFIAITVAAFKVADINSDVTENYQYDSVPENPQKPVAPVTKTVEDKPVTNPQTTVTTKPVVTTTTQTTITTTNTTSTEKTYTLADISVHNSKTSCWTTVGGKVYDITSYVPRHPGGERNILKVCGKDGTSLFEDQHGGDSKPEKMLASLFIGNLSQ